MTALYIIFVLKYIGCKMSRFWFIFFSLFDIQIRCFQRFLYIYDIYNEINGKYTTKRIYFNHCTWDQIHVAGLFMGVYNMDTKNPIANSCPYTGCRAGTIRGWFDSVRFRFKMARFGFFRIGSSKSILINNRTNINI